MIKGNCHCGEPLNPAASKFAEENGVSDAMCPACIVISKPRLKAALDAVLNPPLNIADIVIEKDIPLPGVRKAGMFTELFLKMEPGDSVFLPGVERNACKHSQDQLRKTHNFRFAIRKVHENGKDGLRVWRTE